jgi:hypothetical protein
MADEDVIINFFANGSGFIGTMDEMIERELEALGTTESLDAALKNMGKNAAEVAASIAAGTELDDAYLKRLGITAGEVAAGIRTMDEAIQQTGRNAVEAGEAADMAYGEWRLSILKTMLAVEALDAELDKGIGRMAFFEAVTAGDTAAVTAYGSILEKTAVAVEEESAAEAKANGVHARGFYWMRALGISWHWLISGIAEYLAVAIPGTTALAAGLAVMAQAGIAVYGHMKSLLTATSATNAMFHETIGSVLGLSGAFAKASAAASPHVYEVLGAVIKTLEEGTGQLAEAGVRVSSIFADFMAKVVYDFGPSGGLGKAGGGLMTSMIQDLTEFGQILGNVGHAVVNFAGDMPGLAELLLKVADGASRLALAFTSIPGKIITVVMALEEVNRWGGVFTSVFRKMGIAGNELSGWMLSPIRALRVISNIGKALPLLFTNIVAMIGNLGIRFGSAGSGIESAGKAMNSFAGDASDAIREMPVWQGALITLAAAGVGFLIYKLVTARSSAQELQDALEKNVQNASNVQVFTTLATSIGKVNEAIRANASAMEHVHATSGRSYALDIEHLTILSGQLRAADQKLQQQQVAVVSGASYLAGVYHTSLPGAMELATEAGVKLANGIRGSGMAAQIARIKIADLTEGYKAMGQPAGAVGQDMTALAIQSELAATKVSALNSAWDDFMSNLTGGTSGLASLDQGLKNMANISDTTKFTLSNSLKGADVSVRQFAASLTSFTGKGSQAWQNFNQVVGSSMPQMIDWLRTAGAEGAISGRKFQSGVLDMVSALIPLASKSRTARTEILGLAKEAGLNIDTWPKLVAAVKNGNDKISSLGAIVDQATQKMGNMAQVAQALGNDLQQDVVSAMNAAIFKTSGAARAMTIYAQDIRNGTSSTAAGEGARRALIRDLEDARESAEQARNMISLMQGSINALHGKNITLGITTEYATVGSPAPGRHLGPVGGQANPSVLSSSFIRSSASSSMSTTVHVHVAGSVQAEKDLAGTVQRIMLERAFINPTAGTTWPGRRL